MSSLAQEEIDPYQRMSNGDTGKRFADGKVSVPFNNNFLSYKKGEDGNLVIDEEQAMIVKGYIVNFYQGHHLLLLQRD